jgi:hypothetical protein
VFDTTRENTWFPELLLPHALGADVSEEAEVRIAAAGLCGQRLATTCTVVLHGCDAPKPRRTAQAYGLARLGPGARYRMAMRRARSLEACLVNPSGSASSRLHAGHNTTTRLARVLARSS